VTSSSCIFFCWSCWWEVPCHELLLVLLFLLVTSLLALFTGSLRWGSVAYLRYLLGFSALSASFAPTTLQLLNFLIFVTILNWFRCASSSVTSSPPLMNEWIECSNRFVHYKHPPHNTCCLTREGNINGFTVLLVARSGSTAIKILWDAYKSDTWPLTNSYGRPWWQRSHSIVWKKK